MGRLIVLGIFAFSVVVVLLDELKNIAFDTVTERWS